MPPQNDFDARNVRGLLVNAQLTDRQRTSKIVGASAFFIAKLAESATGRKNMARDASDFVGLNVACDLDVSNYRLVDGCQVTEEVSNLPESERTRFGMEDHT